MIGLDSRSGPWPALDDVDLARLLRALDAGAKPADVARAYGLSPRTVYRYRRARLETVDVAGHQFVFLVFRDPKHRPAIVSRRKAKVRA